MNFEPQEDQRLLKDSLQRFCQAHFPAGKAMTDEDTVAAWTALADLGFLGASFAECDGGLGWGPVEMMIGADVLGAAQADLPWLESGVSAATALRYGAAAIRLDLAGALSDGVVHVFVDGTAAVRDGAPTLALEAVADRYRVSGTASMVTHGDSAERLIVAAGVGDATRVFHVEAAAIGLSGRSYRTIDGRAARDLSFDVVEVRNDAVLAAGPDARVLIERVKQHGIAALAAEAVGLMQAVLDGTVDHLKTRRQFGAPLGKFQSLQHRAAEMLIACEQARSMAMFAALSVDSDDSAARRSAIAAVRSVVGVAARFVAQTAVQLHGGVGVTQAHSVGRAFKRLTMIAFLLDADGARGELADAGGLVPASGRREA